MLGEAFFQVGRFVVVNDVALGQLIDHGNDLWKLRSSICLIRIASQATDGIAGRFVIVRIVCLTYCRLTDALER